MKFTPQLFFLAAVAVGAVHGSPLSASDVTERSSTSCVTYKTGILSTDKIIVDGNFGARKPLAWNSKGQLAYYTDGSHPTIMAEFQKCPGAPGRIYLPATKQCLGISNQASPAPPYEVTPQTCPDSATGEMLGSKRYPFAFDYDVPTHQMPWLGDFTVNSEGLSTKRQGNCPNGYLGYKGLADDSPEVSQSTSYRLEFVCFEEESFGYIALE